MITENTVDHFQKAGQNVTTEKQTVQNTLVTIWLAF